MTYQVAEVVVKQDENGLVQLKMLDAAQPILSGRNETNPVFYKESLARNWMIELELTNVDKTYVIVSW